MNGCCSMTKHLFFRAPVLMLTEGDPWGAPKGGQTTFAKHLLTAFCSRLAVSSYCDDETVPIGKWIYRPYEGQPIMFLNRGAVTRVNDKKPIIPGRISAYFKARQFMTQIRQKDFSGLLIDSPEMLFAAAAYKWQSVCYSFAGVNNPIANSRYPWARIMGPFFEKIHIASLNRIKPDLMIAAADQTAIEEFHNRTGHRLDKSRFYQFPTRVDTDLFHPMNTATVRKDLGIPLDFKVFVTTGRLCWIKGWDLLLEALVHIKKDHPSVVLIFVGDGEDHANVEMRAKALGVQDNIRITGFIVQSEVVRYMNAADVCLVGSHREGWSVAMCEMIACGKPIVSTNVSGAAAMIREGQNGFIVRARSPVSYAEAIAKALKLHEAKQQSLEIAEKYSLKYLARDLGDLWPPLQK